MNSKIFISVINDKLPKNSKRILFFLILSAVVCGLTIYIRENYFDNYFLLAISIIAMALALILGFMYGFMEKFHSIGRLTLDHDMITLKSMVETTETPVSTIRSITLKYDGYQYEPYFTGISTSWMNHKTGSNNFLILVTETATFNYRILISSQRQFNRIQKSLSDYKKSGIEVKTTA